jgi:SlyX protein
MTEERLINIESKIIYLEDTVQALNSAVYRQQKQIDQLRSLCESLLTHVQTLSAESADNSVDSERPPHY